MKHHNHCAGNGSCQHAHSHDHAHSSHAYLRMGISFLLLATGLLLSHYAGGLIAGGVALVWYAAAFLPVGWPIMKEGFEEVRKGHLFNEFTLMILACLGAFLIGEYPEAVAVMLFYTVGETLQHGAVDRATGSIYALLDVRPEKTLVVRDGKLTELSPAQVRPGEIIEVRPGERVALDGILLNPSAAFDASALTGESMPVSVDEGGEVLAGMIVEGAPVRIRVSAPYDRSSLARLIEFVRDASSRKAPAEKFIRRFARVYTPVVFLLAVAVVVVPVCFVSDYVFSEWLYRGLVFLVISCPCALVISVPLGYFAGIGAASRSGILFKGGNYLDAIARISGIAFDKTGTLTSGRFEVTGVDVAPGTDEEELLRVMTSVERRSTHPVAAAVVSYGEARGVAMAEVESMAEIAGKGIEAIVGGKRIAVGNAGLMARNGVECPPAVDECQSTAVFCAVDGRYAGAVMLSDLLKEDAAAAIESLRRLGISNIALVSGDRRQPVGKIASELKIAESFGELLPEDKIRCIDSLKNQGWGEVAFVGDGMNDAPVLALSDVGIAMGAHGSHVAVESADVVIQTDSPLKVAEAVRIGRFTRRVVLENIVFAIGVKLAVILAGACGYVSLWGAVFADVGVSLIAVMNSLRIMAKR